jgi:hypothetical protein
MAKHLTSAIMLAIAAFGTAACSGMDRSLPTPEINPAAAVYPAPTSTSPTYSDPTISGPSDVSPGTNRNVEQDPGAITSPHKPGG